MASLVLLKSTHDLRTQFSFSLSHHLDYGIEAVSLFLNIRGEERRTRKRASVTAIVTS